MMIERLNYFYHRTMLAQSYWLDPSNGTPSNFFVAPGSVGNNFGAILMYALTQVIIPLIGVVCMLFVILGGYYYMVAQGNKDLADRGKKIITNAIIGLVISVMAYVILRVIQRAIVNGAY